MQHQATLEDFRRVVEGLDFTPSRSIGFHTDNEALKVPMSSSLESLLQRAALAEIPSDTVLTHLFGKAMADLRDVLRSADTIDWAAVQAHLAADYPLKKPSVADDGVVLECPAVPEQEDSPSSKVPEDAARQEDLNRQLSGLEAAMNRRKKPHSGFTELLMPGTVAGLERATAQQVTVALEIILATGMVVQQRQASEHAANPRPASSSSCVTEENVLALVEEGLLALQQNADLRNVLRKKVLELDPSATAIILDADLPPPTPKTPTRETTNLRRVLDTPLVLQLAHGIDQLVEWSGGYNDRLDQWIDSLAGGRESVGEKAIRQVLEKSGKVEIPNVENVLNKDYLPKPAQDVLNKII